MTHIPPDLGPSVRSVRGRAVSTGPAAVIVEDRAEPGTTTQVRGARRQSVLLDLCGRGAIDRPMFTAACRFIDDLSLASGARPRDPLSLSRMAPWQRTPAQAQLDALRRVRRVVELLHLQADRVFWWVVIEDRSLSDYDRAHQLRNGTGGYRLRAAMSAVERFYASARSVSRETED